MSTQDDARGTPEQRAFGRWVSDMLAYLEHERGMSLREVARVSGVSHTQIYRWMGRPAAKGYSDAQPEKVRQFCSRLRLPYREAAAALGWISATAPPPDDLEGFIRRARSLAAHPGTSAQRRRALQARIENAETALRMQRMAEELLREALEEQPDP